MVPVWIGQYFDQIEQISRELLSPIRQFEVDLFQLREISIIQFCSDQHKEMHASCLEFSTLVIHDDEYLNLF